MAQEVVALSTSEALARCSQSVGQEALLIKNALENGLAEGFLIGECAFITRFEEAANGKELVVMCAEGKGLVSATSILKQIAKDCGCVTARMHTRRKALARLVPEAGWGYHHTVFKTTL